MWCIRCNEYVFFLYFSSVSCVFSKLFCPHMDVRLLWIISHGTTHAEVSVVEEIPYEATTGNIFGRGGVFPNEMCSTLMMMMMMMLMLMMCFIRCFNKYLLHCVLIVSIPYHWQLQILDINVPCVTTFFIFSTGSVCPDCIARPLQRLLRKLWFPALIFTIQCHPVHHLFQFIYEFLSKNLQKAER